VISQLRGSFSQTPRTLALVFRASPRGAATLMGLTLLGAAMPLAVAYAGKRIVDAVVAGDAQVALRWVGIELALIAGLALCQRGLGLLRSVLGARLSVDVNVMILEKALTLELSQFEDPEFYDRLTKARREASSRPISVVSETFQIIQNVLTLAGYVALLLRFSGWAVLGLVLATVPATVAEMRFSNLGFRLRNWRAPESRRLTYLEHVLANDAHAKEVQLFGLGPLLLGRFRKTAEGIYREDRALALRRSAWGYGLSLLATVAFYGCYAFLAIAAATRRLSLGDLTLYVVAFRQGQQSFQSILSGIGGMYEHNLYMSNLFSYLELPTGTTRGAGELPARAGELGIRFEGVGFKYPGQSSWALRGVSLEIPPGQSLAIVGQNGSGKTTFIKLMTRLYEPTEGAIYLDGKDLRAWERDELRLRIGVIFQDFNRYQLALRENVSVGSVATMDDEARIGRAIEQGGADDIVASLDRGLDTPLGRLFRQEGVELSGGQWQRIALARAFMREEADVLVLDEPTAALDAEAEAKIFERFRALARGRTTILISHRFPTVRTADHIVVLAGGTIVEQGTHDELVAQDGRYARLFKLQAQGYL
jgi:ATP-binding cassette, subfamily B, bacterial